LDHRFDVGKGPRQADHGAFLTRLEYQHFIQPDPLVVKQILRVCADKDLTPVAGPLHVGKETGDPANDRRMKRQLRLFQEQWSGPIEHGPQQSKQSERTVRELCLVLASPVLTPMLVHADKVRRAVHLVSIEPQRRELRYGDLQSLEDPPKSLVSLSLAGSSNLFEKVAPKRIVLPSDRSVRIPNELGKRCAGSGSPSGSRPVAGSRDSR
jgi:hypothetical protein